MKFTDRLRDLGIKKYRDISADLIDEMEVAIQEVITIVDTCERHGGYVDTGHPCFTRLGEITEKLEKLDRE